MNLSGDSNLSTNASAIATDYVKQEASGSRVTPQKWTVSKALPKIIGSEIQFYAIPKPMPSEPRSPHSQSSTEKTQYDPAVETEDTLKGYEAKNIAEDEKLVLMRQVGVLRRKVTYFSLFRPATAWDMAFIAIATISAIVGGAVMPLMTVIFGNLTGTFQGLYLGNLSESFNSLLNKYVLYFVYLAIGEFILIYISTVLFIYTGEHITSKIRQQYLYAILRQNIGFFDELGAGEITTRITADTNLVQEAISEKVGLSLTGIAGFLSAFVIGFVKFWKLTLICSSSIVAILVLMSFGGRYMSMWNKKSVAAYGLGGSVVEEALSSIRNVVAFGISDKLAKKYDANILVARRFGIRTKSILGFMIGTLFCIIFLNYGLAFWMGSRFLVEGETTLSSILTIILAIMIGAFSFGSVGPNVQHFTAGIAAGSKIYSIIDRVSPLDPFSDSGQKLDSFEGTIEFRNVRHIYPSRPEAVVLEHVDLIFPAGTTTALVGASGSGKSTIIGIVERFYNPVRGTVLLDGHDITTLNLCWLRQQIGLVQQEPVLFSGTIKENIKLGLVGSKYENQPEDQQMKRIVEAATKANAHDFISNFPDGYETNVGERGFLLSGGQKQRIAIARAIVSDPKIILLDEATSALDTISESAVQQALEEVARGRTTIIIAHRLSSIKAADNIIVMANGRVVEQGTHDELLLLRKAYYNLVSAQRIDSTDKEGNKVEKDFKTGDGKVTHIPSRMSGHITSQMPGASEILTENTSEPTKYSLWELIKFIAQFNLPEWHVMLVGLFFSCIEGAMQPVQGVFFAEAIVALSRPLSEWDKIRSDANFWSLMYLILAFVSLFATVIEFLAFALCSENLIHRARNSAFRRILRQDVAFFDDAKNSSGTLTSFLSTETTHLASISGATLGTLLNSITTLIISIVVSLAVGWKLALVCMCAVPVILGTGFCRFWILARFSTTSQKHYEQSAGYACEHTNAIRTVASLAAESNIHAEYRRQLRTQLRASLKSTMYNSSFYAASQSAILLANALGFWYGGRLLGSGEYSLKQFFLVYIQIVFSIQSAGTVFSHAGDMSKAKNAAAALRKLYDSKPSIDTWSSDGARVNHVEGLIEFRNVHFQYPTSPDVPVLRGLNLTAQPGQYVGLVGMSGCGKSTILALVERFYDAQGGGIYMDGHNISSLHVNDYRSFIALVSQEPTLYQGTIKENVLLGIDKDDISNDRVIQACKDANIYDLIMSLPDGFNTPVGSKAVMLSGGQKQRIATARALLRDPKILLLDEATSALDSESERAVQAALDAASLGRTTIAVAHRLSTIKKADVIYVLDKGVVSEQGTHQELMAMKGIYWELANLQSLEKQ